MALNRSANSPETFNHTLHECIMYLGHPYTLIWVQVQLQSVLTVDDDPSCIIHGTIS